MELRPLPVRQPGGRGQGPEAGAGGQPLTNAIAGGDVTGESRIHPGLGRLRLATAESCSFNCVIAWQSTVVAPLM